MPIGVSIHIGVNHPDPSSALGRWEDLAVCEAAAGAMQGFAISRGFSPRLILTKEASSDRIKTEIRDAANRLNAGDLLLITYAGHGTQIPDRDGDEPMDQAWVVYDRLIIDDELFLEWTRFQEGVRILVVSDSCHSGTITSLMMKFAFIHLREKMDLKARRASWTALITRSIKASDPIDESPRETQLRCTVKSISATEDGTVTTAGFFTNQLLALWHQRRFASYREFFDALKVTIGPLGGTPFYRTIGKQNDVFDSQSPFSI
jgi:hypothetical protein